MDQKLSSSERQLVPPLLCPTLTVSFQFGSRTLSFIFVPGQWVHVLDATNGELILSDVQVFSYGGTMSIVHDPTNTINVSLIVHGEEISSLQGCERLAIELAAPDAALIRRTARTAGPIVTRRPITRNGYPNIAMTLRYRPFVSSDRDDCIAVFETNVPRFFRDHELQSFTDFIDSSDHPYLVVVSDKETVGCGGYSIQSGSDTADLCWGMVDSRYHGHRIGEYLLLIRLQEIAKVPETQFVRLGTCQHTAGFFRRYGFETQSIIENGIADGLDDVEMKLVLSEWVRREDRQR